MKNVYVYNENIGEEDLIIESDGSYPKADKVIELTDEQVNDIKSKIETNQLISRCIRVFRDGLIIDNVIYNICFSCGDVIINDKVCGINDDLKETLRNLLK